MNSISNTSTYSDAIRRLEEALPEVVNSSDQSVIVMGETGVGKSTLINLLAGKQLSVEYVETLGTTQINVVDPVPGMEVGHATASQTDGYHKWVGPNGVAFWDCPGLLDNRGPVQELVNALSFKKLFDISHRVKIVVMLKESDLSDTRSTALMRLVRDISTIFTDSMDRLHSSSLLVVSQAPEERNVGQVRANINRVIQQIPMPNIQKRLLESLRDNPTCIFKTPPRDGQVLLSKEEVFGALDHIPFAEHIKAHIGISDECRGIVMGSYNQISKNVDQAVEEFLMAFRDAIQTFSVRAIERKDKVTLDALLPLIQAAIASGADTSPQGLKASLHRCRELAERCGSHLPINELMRVLNEVDTRCFLEQFVEARVILTAFSSTLEKLYDVKNLVESAKQAIGIKEAEERRAEAERKAESARKEADARKAEADRREAQEKREAAERKAEAERQEAARRAKEQAQIRETRERDEQVRRMQEQIRAEQQRQEEQRQAMQRQSQREAEMRANQIAQERQQAAVNASIRAYEEQCRRTQELASMNRYR